MPRAQPAFLPAAALPLAPPAQRAVCARRAARMAVQRPERCGAGMQRVATASDETLAALGCRGWRTWSCGAKELPWNYGLPEACFLLEGDVLVVASGGEEMRIRAGDVAWFPSGLECVWKVEKPVNKHFLFETDLSVLEK